MAGQSWGWAGLAALALASACASEGGSTPGPLDTLKRYVLGDGTTQSGAKLLNTDRLREVARAHGVGSGPSPMPFNREVGAAFQEWALRAFPGRPLLENGRTYQSGARRAATRLRPGGPVLAIRPDAVGGAVTMVWGQLMGTFEVPQAVNAPDSVFVEVKAIRGALSLSHSSHQITGFIDVAANSPAALMTGPERPTPAIVFVTTGDTTIAPTVLEAASLRRVAIWQTLVFELPGSTTATPKFGLGPVVPLNPAVYGSSWPEPIPPGPTNVPFPLPPVFRTPPVAFDDPDPPEVQ